jgi:Kef-type K+ transport system membrane component KefB
MKKMEFSKLLAIIVTALFVCTVGFVTLIWAVTNKTPEQLQIGISILGVVAAPFGVIITGYFAKSGVENFQKIKQGGNHSEGDN